MRFKVYIDYTTEATPRPFYVGKGSDKRVKLKKRNKLHTAIAAKYGLDRRVVFETDNESAAFELEQKLIVEHSTYVYAGGWGANFTLGGEGTSGAKFDHRGEKHPLWGKHHSEESKRKNSESNKTTQTGEKNGMWGKCHTEETRHKIGEKSRGRVDSEETRAKKSAAAILCNTGRKLSEQTKQKISEARKGRVPWNKGMKKHDDKSCDKCGHPTSIHATKVTELSEMQAGCWMCERVVQFDEAAERAKAGS